MPSHTGLVADFETPRIATSGAFTIGVKPVPPMPPSELIEKQPPDISAGPSFLSRALTLTVASSAASSSRPLRSQSRITGTTSPSGVSTAMPTWKYCLSTRFSPVASSEALKFGNFFSAATTALIWNTSGETLRSLFSSPSFLRKASISVMSASSCWVTCGIITQLRARLAPEIFLIRDSGLDSTGPNLAKSTCGHGSRLSPVPPPAAAARGAPPCIVAFTNAATSAREIRPLRSLPLSCARSTPSSRANARTPGLACGTLSGSTCELSNGTGGDAVAVAVALVAAVAAAIAAAGAAATPPAGAAPAPSALVGGGLGWRRAAGAGAGARRRQRPLPPPRSTPPPRPRSPSRRP